MTTNNAVFVVLYFRTVDKWFLRVSDSKQFGLCWRICFIICVQWKVSALQHNMHQWLQILLWEWASFCRYGQRMCYYDV